MRTWIFQSNPKIYDVGRAVRTLRKDTWLVHQHGADIHPGDCVYLWESGSNAGIVGVAEVLDEVSDRNMPKESESFVRDSKKLGGVQARVLIRINSVVDPRLTRLEIVSHPELADLAILRQPQGTNFPVTPEQAKTINTLLPKA